MPSHTNYCRTLSGTDVGQIDSQGFYPGEVGNHRGKVSDSLDLISKCAGCELWRPLDDLGLCAECAAKLDRDLIRERAWDYSSTAFTWDPNDSEALRQRVIAEYGAAYELIIPEGADKKRLSKKKSQQRKPKP